MPELTRIPFSFVFRNEPLDSTRLPARTMVAPLSQQALTELGTTLRDAYARVLGESGAEFLARLQTHRATLDAHFHANAALLEAYATLAEWDGAASTAAKEIGEALPSLASDIVPLAHALLGRLLVLSGSRERASHELAEAELGAKSVAGSARVARDRALLAMTERQWSKAEHDLTHAEALSDSVNDALIACEAATYRAVALIGNGNAAEALDLLITQFERVPTGGLLELRSLLAMARAHVDRVEMDRAAELFDRAETLCSPELFEPYARIVHGRSEIAVWRENWAQARQHVEALRLASVERALPIYETHACYTRALLEFDAGDFDSAFAYATKTIEVASAIEHHSLVTAARLILTCTLAKLERRDEALKNYRALRRPNIEGADALYFDGMCALAEILLAHLATSTGEGATFDALAKGRIAKLVERNAQGVRHIESNYHLYVVARRLRRYASLRGVDLHIFSRVRPASVDSKGRWIELSDGERVSIEQRPVLCRLLACLSLNAKQRPLTAVMPRELFDATWPNDRSSESSLRVRLRVAIATLRQLGLEDAIETRDGGYFLSL